MYMYIPPLIINMDTWNKVLAVVYRWPLLKGCFAHTFGTWPYIISQLAAVNSIVKTKNTFRLATYTKYLIYIGVELTIFASRAYTKRVVKFCY